MRLGDLDALKEDFKSRLGDCNEWIEKAKDKETKIRASAVKAFICEVIMTIDNTKPVEAFTKDDMAGAYNEGYACGSRENARPQGECKCVSCKYRDCDITEKPCRECSRSWVDHYEAADMRKGGAEND